MCTQNYLNNKNISANWYIDTCSLLNKDGLNNFISSKKDIIDKGIKIIVIKPVFEELNRLLYSNDEFLAKDAQYSINTIQKNKDMFVVEGLNEQMRIDEAFADPDIIGCIMKRCTKKSQLVITQDKKLATDLLNIQKLNSFNSRKVFVCFLAIDGELYRNKGINQEENAEESIFISKETVVNDVEGDLLVKYAQPLLYTVAGITIGAFGTYAYQNKSSIYKNVSNLSMSIRRCFSC